MEITMLLAPADLRRRVAASIEAPVVQTSSRRI